MRRYLLSLLAVCLIGLAIYQYYQPVSIVDVITNEKLEIAADNLNKRHPMKTLELSDYAKSQGVTLQSPLYQQFATNQVVNLQGRISLPKQYPTQFVWVQIDYKGTESKADFLQTFHYYIPIKNDQFQQSLTLQAGKGEYQVTVRMPSNEKKEKFYTLTSFEVTNVNPEINREISYNLKGRESQLQLSKPAFGLVKTSRLVQISGSIKEKQLLVQLRKGDQVWRKTYAVHDGRFDESIPLLYGDGIHEVKLMVPDHKKAGYFVEGALFYVQNTSPQVSKPIEYTRLYYEKGIRLTNPLSSGDQADLTYPIAGTIDPSKPGTDQINHVVVQTEKGKEKATYFIPVHQYRFDGNFWFRFGPGTYRVILYIPDASTTNRDYFRFLGVASFQVTSHVLTDQRDLLPSRGIQSDNPQIYQLAKQVTQGAKTDYKKARKIYDYVATMMTYDMYKLRHNSFAWDDSALKSLQERKGVCQDYVFLAIAMLRSLDIPSRFVEGEAGNQRHAWVEVKIGDHWISMDPTWGSGYITPNGKFVKKYDSNYFNPSKRYLNKTHKRTGVVY
ncbi:Transglutaminase-like superfamily protein [Seinonella peptonophila]|uniref:Transglutaminase-like superfamily protein n=1 Tax=Seinonella peptonophila TaxID=112248 RepID=A0A1M5AI51_9BACL|nr:transglutaminase-like domain-containing protein [Seinonella peptonophila]SHF29794.1 Transglutaminase-like superfamily protein [Seinonella peptonophila]